MNGMRLLPWTGEGGKPAYLAPGSGESSFVNRLADGLEAVQLGMADDLLDHVETSLREQPRPGEAQLALTVTHLCHALRDVLRVAHSRGDRLPAREPDAWTAAADAVLDREVDR